MKTGITRRTFLRSTIFAGPPVAIAAAFPLVLPTVSRAANPSARARTWEFEEASIATLQARMNSGRESAVSLSRKYLERIAVVDVLRGKRLGIRHDRAWRSFEIFSDELKRIAREQLGVDAVVRFDPGTRIGSPEAEVERAEAFAARVDAAVVGLGT